MGEDLVACSASKQVRVRQLAPPSTVQASVLYMYNHHPRTHQLVSHESVGTQLAGV